MHIAVVSLGAFGHVNPTLELVTELVRRGALVSFTQSLSVQSVACRKYGYADRCGLNLLLLKKPRTPR